MNPSEIIQKIEELGGKIKFINEELKVRFPKGFSDSSILNLIRDNKEKIISSLQKLAKLPKIELSSDYEVSSSQRRLWVLSQFEEGSFAYNMPGVYELEGNLEKDNFVSSFSSLLERHESLRTVFTESDDGEVRQVVQSVEDLNFSIECYDYQNEPEVVLKDSIKNELSHTFNLATGPLLRASLYQVKKEKYVFTFVMHHIISDGWSMGVLVKDLLTIYNAKVSNQPIPLEPLRIHYKDYSAWQQEQLQAESFEKHKEYWLEQFSGELPVLDLPNDYTRPAVKTYNGKTVSGTINKELSKKINTLSLAQGGTLFMGLLSLVNALFYRYTGQEDIILGSPIAGRDHVDLENQIGFYVNTLALRSRFSGSNNYKELLEQTKEVTLSAYEHQMYPFDELVNELRLSRDTSRNALFDVMVVLQNNDTSTGGQSLGDVKVSPYEGANDYTVSKFDMTYNFVETETGEIAYSIEYNTDIYSERFVSQMSNHLVQLLEQVTSYPNQSIGELDYLTEQEKYQILHEFNNTKVDYPKNKTIIDLFEEQAKKTPTKIAVFFEGIKLTYQELNEKSNQLGNYLRDSYSIVPDDLVGIKLARSEQMIIAILGVLKSGGAYVPIDPEYPEARIKYIEENSCYKVLLDNNILAHFNKNEKKHSINNLTHISGSKDLAYVIYTSGSTGKPKGVEIEHASLLNTIFSYEMNFKRSLLTCNYVFDVSVLEIFSPIIAGSCLFIPTIESVQNSSDFAKYLVENKIECCYIHPFQISEVSSYLQNMIGIELKRILVGVESILKKDVLWYLKQGINVINGYGPTENSICSTFFSVPKESVLTKSKVLSIGKPISNSGSLILSGENILCPIGIVGEICLSGTGLARGYLNQEELTKQKFIPHPFIDEERLYKTGDLGYWLSDGNIEFLSRKDDQVKIRGYRIELGEIEANLKQIQGVDNCVVVARTISTSTDKEIVAYLKGTNLLVNDLRSALSKVLPAYMIPSYFVELERFPLTTNGKVDKKSLPNPDGKGMSVGVDFIAPSTETEKIITAIWSEILDVEKEIISVNHDFFSLGGHSIKATKLINRIHKIFQVKQNLKSFFINPTIKSQASFIEVSNKEQFINIEILDEGLNYTLSSSQSRLWLLSQLEDVNTAYNIPAVYELEGHLDKAIFNSSFADLLNRHESLRTVFSETNEGEIFQIIKSEKDIGFSLIDLDYRDKSKKDLEKIIYSDSNTTFDLSKGPLLKASLYRTGNNKYVFSFVTHHIISDGWSMGILLRDLLTFYNAKVNKETVQLESLRIQYKDYSAWQQNQLKGEISESDKSYWLDQFTGDLPILNLPSDYSRPPIKTYNGNIINGIINYNLSKKLNIITKSEGGTLFMGLLSLVKTLFYNYTGQEDITIGSPIAAREHVDLENQIGFYNNTLAIRTKFKGYNSFKELLLNIKEVTLGAYTHQMYPFDELVRTLDLNRDISRNPLFDVMVVLQNNDMTAGGQTLGDIKFRPFKGENNHVVSKFDMIFIFLEVENGISYNIEYNTDIYSEKLITQMSNHLVQLLEQIIINPNQPIKQLDYLSKAENFKILHEFNNKETDYPKEKTIVQLFEEQVEMSPDSIAVVFNKVELSYRELNEKSNQLSHYLQSSYNIKADDLIGIKLERSEQMIIAILGILKSGGAYLPIDPSSPEERIDFMLKDSGCKALLESDTTKEKNIDSYSIKNLNSIISPNSLAYVVYTSGSTGVPKGVMVNHTPIVRLAKSTNYINTHEIKNVLGLSNFSFDGSTFDIYLPILNGGKIIICEKDLLSDIELFESTILQEEIDCFFVTTALFNKLVEAEMEVLSKVKYVLFGGEQVSVDHVSKFKKLYPNVKLHHVYGPTENTTFSTWYPIQKIDSNLNTIPIGSSISNGNVYIFRNETKLSPIGIVGEIYVGGDGLSRGYLNNPKLTLDKFIPHPYKNGEKLYKTGDLGKWNFDGDIEFIGRKDDQVKIRGHRIELGEIEFNLQQIEKVNSCVVLAKSIRDTFEKDLVAYVQSDLSISELIDKLTKVLPSYMIPTYFVKLDSFPITPNGKVDKKLLPEPEELEQTNNSNYVAPRNKVEEVLVTIWGDILKIKKEKISIHDDFFRIGGTSLHVIELNKQLQKFFPNKINVAQIFELRTIVQVSDYFNNTEPSVEEEPKTVGISF